MRNEMVNYKHKLFKTKSEIDYSFNVEDIIKEHFKNSTVNNVTTNIEAGHTYLGQMIAHDIVPSTTLHLNRKNINQTLNLDSIYGDKNNQACFDKNGKFILGYALSPLGNKIFGKDLLRGTDSKAMIPDARNDENIIISQLHLFWQKFHNSIFDELKLKFDLENYFECTKFILTKLFHDIVLFDYMKKLIHPSIYSLYAGGYSFFYKNNVSFSKVPLEFSHAVFRFGHSMVRESYNLNNDKNVEINDVLGNRNLILKTESIIDWGFFFSDYRIIDSHFSMPQSMQKKTDSVPVVQSAMKIDTKIIPGMTKVPFICGKPDDIKNINLKAGNIMKLNFGQEIKVILEKNPIFNYYFLKNPFYNSQLNKIPLWLYILKEAELETLKGLGLIGSIIVSEVLTNSIYSTVFNHKATKYQEELKCITSSIKKNQKILEQNNAPTYRYTFLNSEFLRKPLSMGYCTNYINRKR